MSKIKRKILVVGQTPPPYHGQAIMIEEMLKVNYNRISLYHVRMAFSKDLDAIGRFNVRKVFHLFMVIIQILYKRFRYSIPVLYFPPTGPKLIAFYRDAIVLTITRPFFKKVCFHFHAAGISELYPSLDAFSKFIFRKAYFSADLGIRLSQHSTDDCLPLQIKKQAIIPYGIEDHFNTRRTNPGRSTKCRLLFVGLLTESKGIKILLEACHSLKARGIDFALDVLGKFESAKFEKELRDIVRVLFLNENIHFHGVVTGEHKYLFYLNSDVFCFPSFYEAESFPVVLLEACSFGLPIVSTRWRGIPSIVTHRDNGFLCSIKDAQQVAAYLEDLILNSDLRREMGARGRSLFLKNFTLQSYYRNIENSLLTI
ncbi:glycosyltransferase family 4 protein [Chryseosolibacter indicus]|uniref:Glycosyltransferase family 4 protein n=1 Tax=Chryseosolibacter indicus TaxID=2782351 RepID=A0ABS5VT92_9BACT|nr:glycosyltransferase family 4 protein [Chryseosolibacter indicus]MBT1704571.1 glycosyltransferase family 4 protein [Chryseosolibacter indicus]